MRGVGLSQCGGERGFKAGGKKFDFWEATILNRGSVVRFCTGRATLLELYVVWIVASWTPESGGLEMGDFGMSGFTFMCDRCRSEAGALVAVWMRMRLWSASSAHIFVNG